MKKKGIFFTFIAITLTAVVILSFIIHTQYRLRNKMFVIETRIDTLNDFIQDTETDLERGLYIAAFRAILSLEQYITTEGVFLNNTELNFKEIVIRPKLAEKVEVKIPQKRYRPSMSHPYKRQMFMARIAKESNYSQPIEMTRKDSSLELMKR